MHNINFKIISAILFVALLISVYYNFNKNNTYKINHVEVLVWNMIDTDYEMWRSSGDSLVVYYAKDPESVKTALFHVMHEIRYVKHIQPILWVMVRIIQKYGNMSFTPNQRESIERLTKSELYKNKEDDFSNFVNYILLRT